MTKRETARFEESESAVASTKHGTARARLADRNADRQLELSLLLRTEDWIPSRQQTPASASPRLSSSGSCSSGRQPPAESQSTKLQLATHQAHLENLHPCDPKLHWTDYGVNGVYGLISFLSLSSLAFAPS